MKSRKRERVAPMTISRRVEDAVKILLADQINLRQFIELSHEIVLQAYKNLGSKQGMSADDLLPEVILIIESGLSSFDLTNSHLLDEMDSSLKCLINDDKSKYDIEDEKAYSLATVLSAMLFISQEATRKKQLQNILKCILNGVNDGIHFVETKRKNLAEKAENNKSEKVTILDDALGVNEPDWLNSERKNTLYGLRDKIESCLTTDEQKNLTIHDITAIISTFKTIVENKIIAPFKKHPEELSFTMAVKTWFARTKEKISDGIKKFFGFGTLSTRGTLFAVKKDVGKFLTIADKKAKGINR